MAWLVLLAVCLAGWRVRHSHSLFCYFFAQAVYVPVVWGVAHFSGDTSLEYLVAYSVMTGLILACVAWIALESVLSARSAAFAGVLAITVTRMAFVSLPGAHAYDWVHLVEAGVLLWAALCVGGRAPYLENGAVSLVLGLLWLAQAFFRIGFILHIESWLAYNWRVPPALCIAAFGLVALLAPRRHSPAVAD